MPPLHRGSLGYRGVRERRSGVYYTEIRSGDVRLSLGTFETSHEVFCYSSIYTREQPQELAPPPGLITDQDCDEHRRRHRRLLVAEEDERAMAEWRRRHLEDVAAENAF
ncbi:putative AP2 protein [Hordeum vulgare]|nr:putative AP2 protein [Hordeum vulgare]